MATTAHRTTAVGPAPDDDNLPPIQRLTKDEGRAIFDQEARSTFGISGDEFLHRYDAGAYSAPEIFDGPDHFKLIDLVMLLPLVR